MKNITVLTISLLVAAPLAQARADAKANWANNCVQCHGPAGKGDTDWALAPIRQELAQGEYQSVHNRSWEKVWRPWDGVPMRGNAAVYDPTGCYRGEARRYPTETAIDVLVDRILEAVGLDDRLVGVESRDWKTLILVPWLYPVGTALSRHVDGVRYSGAFTWFAHPRWGASWGGDLVVEPADPEVDISPEHEPWTAEEDLDAGIGMAMSIAPRPNRLVLLGCDRPHRVTRVDANAGARVRSTIAGFFLRDP